LALNNPSSCLFPYLPPGVAYIRDIGTRREHWILPLQLSLVLSKKQRIGFIKKLLGPECHAELSRSLLDRLCLERRYKIDGTPFELGRLPIKRNCQKDWDAVKSDAERGRAG